MYHNKNVHPGVFSITLCLTLHKSLQGVMNTELNPCMPYRGLAMAVPCPLSTSPSINLSLSVLPFTEARLPCCWACYAYKCDSYSLVLIPRDFRMVLEKLLPGGPIKEITLRRREKNPGQVSLSRDSAKGGPCWLYV